MFMVRKVLAALMMPVALIVEIALVGLLLWKLRCKRTGKVLLGVAIALLVLLSCHSVADLLLRPLEYQYPALTEDRLAELERSGAAKEIRWIVVLGGGHIRDDALPLTGQIGHGTVVRVAEGVRLYRRLPGAKLLLSGGTTFGDRSDAQYMAEAARLMAVGDEDIALETDSHNTADQARFLADRLKGESFILVTSAYHMPRSMALFRKQGLRGIPAPAGHYTHRNVGWSVLRFIPSTGGLVKSRRAFYETAALLWAKLRGQA